MVEPDPPPQLGGEAGSLPAAPGSEALPEFLNPESVHYQPWAEKQISNASKEKRPLADYMAEMEERLGSYGELPQARWDPERQERLLARFAVTAPGRSRRRHRRRGGATGAAVPSPPETRPGSAARGQRRRRQTPTIAATPPPSPAAPDPGAHRRRRRRRRPRTGDGTPTSPSG
jgi:hypothetical protein